MTITNELPDTLQAAEMVRCAGISYRQLDWWTNQGWLRPDERPKSKSGYRRSYPESEYHVAYRMARLTEAGLIASVAAQVARTGEDRTAVILELIATCRADNNYSVKLDRDSE